MTRLFCGSFILHENSVYIAGIFRDEFRDDKFNINILILDREAGRAEEYFSYSLTIEGFLP